MDNLSGPRSTICPSQQEPFRHFSLAFLLPTVYLWHRRIANFDPLFSNGGAVMSRHNEMPPIPPANRSQKGVGGQPEIKKDASSKSKRMGDNTAEQGETANIRQNTTNAGFFKGRRVK
jgi:hypothetical protein